MVDVAIWIKQLFLFCIMNVYFWVNYVWYFLKDEIYHLKTKQQSLALLLKDKKKREIIFLSLMSSSIDWVLDFLKQLRRTIASNSCEAFYEYLAVI